MHLSLNKMFNSGQILKLIGAIDDKLLEKSTSNMPLKPSWKSKDITPDESKQIFCRYEESLAIEKWIDYHFRSICNLNKIKYLYAAFIIPQFVWYNKNWYAIASNLFSLKSTFLSQTILSNMLREVELRSWNSASDEHSKLPTLPTLRLHQYYLTF